MPTLKFRLWTLAAVFTIASIVMVNLGIYFSSTSHHEQDGWAIFCVFNAAWIFALGGVCACVAESNSVAMRELDRHQHPVGSEF